MRTVVRSSKKSRLTVLVFGIGACVFALSSSAFGYNEALTQKYQRILTSEICNDAAWLKCFQVNSGTCSTVFTPTVEQCVGIHLRNRKTSVKNKEEIEELSDTIATCIHTVFTEKHKDSKLHNDDCKDIH